MQNRKEKQFEKFDSFEDFFDQVEQRADYLEERAKLEFTREILAQMETNGVSRTEFASRLQVQPGMVTRLLSGRNNFELITMVRMAKALNCRYRSHLEPMNAKTIWFDISSYSTPLTNISPAEENAAGVEFIPVETVTCDTLKNEPLPVAA